MTYCIDASLVLRLLLREPGCDEAQRWFASHAEAELVAPHLLLAEVCSALRRKARQGRMGLAEVECTLRFLDGLNVRLVDGRSLARRAYALAEELDQPTIYDTLYLAVAEVEGCELWTVDEQFARKAGMRYPFVRLLSG